MLGPCCYPPTHQNLLPLSLLHARLAVFSASLSHSLFCILMPCAFPSGQLSLVIRLSLFLSHVFTPERQKGRVWFMCAPVCPVGIQGPGAARTKDCLASQGLLFIACVFQAWQEPGWVFPGQGRITEGISTAPGDSEGGRCWGWSRASGRLSEQWCLREIDKSKV